MGIFSDLTSLLQIPEYLAKIPFSRLHAAFAYLIVPGIVILALAGEIAYGGLDHRVSVMQLHSSLSSEGTVQADRRLLVILEGQVSRVGVPLQGIAERSSLLSVPEDVAQRNRNQLLVDEHGLEIQMPLVGADSPLAFVINGESSGDIFLPGKRTTISNLRFRPRGALSLAIWCLFPVMIGLGLVIDRYTIEYYTSVDMLSRK